MLFEKRHAVLFLAVFILTILFAGFLGQVITFEELFGFDFLLLVEKVYSINLWLFIITAPLPLALIIVSAKHFKRNELILFSVLGSALGLITADVMFPSLRFLWLVQLLYIASIPLAIATAMLRFDELKRFVVPRAISDSFKKSVLLVGAGMLLTSIMVILPEQEKYIDTFETKLVENALKGMGEQEIKETVDTFMVDFAIQNQQMAMASVTSLPGYGSVVESDEAEHKTFVAGLVALQQQIGSEQYREQMLDAAREANQETELEQFAYRDTIIKSTPFLATAEQFLGLFYGFLLLGIVSLVGNIIMGPLAALYGFLLSKTIVKEKKEAKPLPVKAASELK